MSPLEATDPTFFATSDEWRAWLERHHDSAPELWVGFHRKATGRPSITWPEAVDQALCFGWIDGIRKRVDGERYAIRFTPRRRTSVWSNVNLARIEELLGRGLVHPAGLAAHGARRAAKSGIYAYEQRGTARLPAPMERELKRNAKAWKFFHGQPQGYQRIASWWVISAKKEETRRRRLAALIADSAAGRRIQPLTRAKD